MTNLLAGVILAAFAQTNDKTQANGYDNGWETAWIAHCRGIYVAPGATKTAGFVLQIGDSITHSNPYRSWPRSGAGNMSTEDATLVSWCRANATLPGTMNDTTSKDGFYLATADTVVDAMYGDLRGMTAASGVDANEFITGGGNSGNPAAIAMPVDTTQASAAAKVADATTYGANLRVETMAAAFGDAQFAVLMLGTNDVNWTGRTSAAFATDLTSIVNTLEAKNIVVILSTIPPMRGKDVTSFNTEIRSLAQTRGLPLIDYYAEILARQPTTWDGTLIGADGIHPTGAASGANPYVSGGSSATHTTGTNAANDGYLLRSWLTIQKLKEVYNYIVLGNNPAAPAPVPVPGSGVGDGSSDNSRCGCGAATLPGAPFALMGSMAAALALLLAARRRA